MATRASILIPTRERPDYLQVALASIAPQAALHDAEVIVVDDGKLARNAELAATFGARYVSLGRARGLNVARNAGLAAAAGELIIYVDDDVEVSAGWLEALLGAARAHPEIGVFTGPVQVRFDGRRLRGCGREGGPITFLELGEEDRDTTKAWGVNLAIRRAAFDQVGNFDERRSGGGDEEEWERRYVAAGGRMRYIAAAALDHRRAGDDTRLRPLMRAAYRRGGEVRRFDAEDGAPPSIASELRVFLGCLWHIVRRRCENGLVMAAHSAGRLSATRAKTPPSDDFLSGESGTVGGRRDLVRELADRLLDLSLMLRTVPRATIAPRRVLVLSIVRERNRELFAAITAELGASQHEVTISSYAPGERGKFENLNVALAEHDLTNFDWLLVVDDDIVLGGNFLARFLALVERHDLRLAQPAHRLRSHAAWRLTRRRWGSLVRETAFVEIGPLTALRRDTFATLLPFPDLRMGWGLDAHWAALAAAAGWRVGIVDATPIAHLEAPVGDSYGRDLALSEARAFLAEHDYLPATQSQRTFAVHRR